MRYPFDLSIAQRLSVGFGALLLMLAVLVGAVLAWQQASGSVQDIYVSNIGPLTERAEALERAVLYVGIGLRDHLLRPNAERRARYRTTTRQVRQALADLEVLPKGSEGERLFEALVPTVTDYLAIADDLATTPSVAGVSAARETQVADARERALDMVRAFVQFQEARADTALALMAGARTKASRGLIAASGFALLFFVVLAVLTTQAVRRPAQDLVRIAGALEAGDWQPALAWARPLSANPDRRDRAARNEMRQLAYAFGAAALALQQREGRLQGLLVQLQEKNEEVQAQNEELQAQNEEIQAQNEEIHAQNQEIQAQNDEIQHHAVLLAQADERKNEFLGVLAHELRNPLAAMVNSIFILQRTAPDDPRALRAKAVIERQTRHLTRLIDDLLDVTRISHGKVRLDIAAVNLVDVVRACVEDHRERFDSRGVALDVHLPDAPLWCDADRTRLSQVVGNLLSNALKFTDAGGRVRLTMTTAGGQAVMRIADSGIGIPGALMPRVFEAFSQDAGSARSHGGLGLGLALVKALVELHGGSVTASSDGPGRGAEFVVRLPLMAAAPVSASRSSASVRRSPLRVLVVEHDRDAAARLREALEYEGHTVSVAHTGADALHEAVVVLPDVVICDIGLPREDGYAVAQRLRGHERLRTICLIALTGYASDADRARALEAGFDHHLAKPADIVRLEAIMAEVAALRAEM